MVNILSTSEDIGCSITFCYFHFQEELVYFRILIQNVDDNTTKNGLDISLVLETLLTIYN